MVESQDDKSFFLASLHWITLSSVATEREWERSATIDNLPDGNIASGSNFWKGLSRNLEIFIVSKAIIS